MLTSRSRRPRGRQVTPATGRRTGIALPATLFVLVILSLLVTGLFAMTDLNVRSSRNREDWSRANHLAEAGLTHALGILTGPLLDTSMTRLLRGADGVGGTADDGVLAGYGHSTAFEIPLMGQSFDGGKYFVSVVDDPQDTDGDPLTDGNLRVLLRCRAVTASGSSAEVNAIVSNFALPGIAVDGDLEISGKPALLGNCGGIHANGNLFGSGQPTVAKVASATGSISLSVSPTLAGQPAIDIPTLDPLEYCTKADFTITGNFVLESTTAPGTYCVHGNVTTSGDFGSWTNMKSVSIIATGSISISSKPFIEAAHPDGILLLAGGDLDLQGDWGGRGIAYAGGHCYISSKPVLDGQLICKSRADPAGADDRTDQNLISGDPTITYGCTGILAEVWRIHAWYPTIGIN